MIEFIVAILTVVVIGWPTALIGLSLVQVSGRVLKQLAIDTIEVHARAHQARIDAETRRAELEYWQDKAQAELHERRQKLLTGGG